MPRADSAFARFLSAPTGPAWRRVGARRRAGVAAPLFSLHSSKSAGVGELTDLPLLGDWCVASGISLIQLLPMNDTGFNFRPYDSESSFALEPLYLNLETLSGVDRAAAKRAHASVKRRFKAGGRRVDFGVKLAKLEKLEELFKKSRRASRGFSAFAKRERSWLLPYVQFKTVKETDSRSWQDWPEPLRRRDPAALAALEKKKSERFEFHSWVQWQLHEQFVAARKTLAKKGVLLMGDLPFLVSRDSADVWAHSDHFKIDFASGAPPDFCFSKGQRWGMPPYDWEGVFASGAHSVKDKLRYASDFYDLFRIDHFVGIFRVWTFPQDSDEGAFDPPDEKKWEAHGRRVLKAILAGSSMLPCAEDLGTVPECSSRVLQEYAIPGTDVQRWARDGAEFRPPDRWRPNGIAAVSTHDLPPLRAWWRWEAGTVDEGVFRARCQSRGWSADEIAPKLFDLSASKHGRLWWREDFDGAHALAHALGRGEREIQDFIGLYRETHGERGRFRNAIGVASGASDAEVERAAIEACQRAASVFGIQLLQDWLSLGNFPAADAWDFRINFPGIVDVRNWSMVIPDPLERLARSRLNPVLKGINERSGRV